ncbi:MAG: PEP-CTERM system histidine kinase PrsK [Cellvibrionaceae bacterium]|nr:PEP-CTERM system histidine kinase PrsK [Cellvibrionaceae bacterium]
MEFSNVTQTAFFSAAILSLIFAISFSVKLQKTQLHFSFVIAAFFNTLWLFAVALYNLSDELTLRHILMFEALHYSGWIIAFTKTTEKLCPKCLPLSYKVIAYIICSLCSGLALFWTVTDTDTSMIESILIWQGIAFSIIGLLSIEQLYRNVVNNRLIKLLCICIAAALIFDAYLFSQNLVFAELNSELWQARAAVSMAISVVLTIGAITLSQPSLQSARLTFSRPVAFYTTSLTLAGTLLTVLSFGGYYVRLYGGNWGTVFYTILLISGVIFLAFIFSSKTMRENLSVQINKHLFSHKYDYRTEWLKLIGQLSQTVDSDKISSHAIEVTAGMFKCDAGALWLKRGKALVPAGQANIDTDFSEIFEPDSSEFCQILNHQEWVFFPNTNSAALAQHNEFLPEWTAKIADIWLIIPLLSENSLIGFLVLANPQSRQNLNWEDLDLIKTVGRQIASYLERHEQSEKLAQSRQFDAFNKLSAYLMHDLKNLIAQQSLVVKNAEQHKDNPAFIEDAINTISNSVNRMNNLLRKLQHNEPEEIKVFSLKEVLVEAVKRCQKSVPTPSITSINPEWKIKADFDSLVMVFTHVIQNAQDATPSTGFVEVSAREEAKLVTITIEDNGSGMDEDFVQNRLFKPFDTTKSGKGMGIGMYQAKEYSQSIGGNISVESSPGEGTTFIISLPTI